MKEFKCHKCDSKDVFIKENGSQIGLYCGDCGKWIQWLNKQDRLLADRYLTKQQEVATNDGVDAAAIASALSEIEKVVRAAGVSMDEAVRLIVSQSKST